MDQDGAGGRPSQQPRAVLRHRWSVTLPRQPRMIEANALRPQSRTDEAGGIAPAAFRALLAKLLAAGGAAPR